MQVLCCGLLLLLLLRCRRMPSPLWNLLDICSGSSSNSSILLRHGLLLLLLKAVCSCWGHRLASRALLHNALLLLLRRVLPLLGLLQLRHTGIYVITLSCCSCSTHTILSSIAARSGSSSSSWRFTLSLLDYCSRRCSSRASCRLAVVLRVALWRLQLLPAGRRTLLLLLLLRMVLIFISCHTL